MAAITLGILGGGQLGRMSAQAARKLDIRTIIYCPDLSPPAAQVADQTIRAAYDDESALKAFAQSCDFITYEFENIPVKTVRYLTKLTSVLPDERLLGIAQDRLYEKQYLNDIGIPTTQWHKITAPQDIETIRNQNPGPMILKTARLGYDGKGQIKIDNTAELDAAYRNLGGGAVIAEQCVDFDYEISVIVARDNTGRCEIYGPTLNVHKNHILHRSLYPAPISATLSSKAISMALKLAESIALTGVLGLELFVTKDGKILANEIAPRTHNSGHWSIDSCAVSQFENHVRAVCGLPVLPPAPHHAAEMINLIGPDIDNLSAFQNRPDIFIHLYGKKEAKPGRKMGHVTILKEQLPGG